MADFVESTVQDIDRRLSELKQEVESLEAARKALIGTRRRPGRPRGGTGARSARGRGRPGPGRSRRRRSGNTRAAQALELVRNRPGITIPQIAESMKIEPNYLYRVMPRLVEDGQVRREGEGWHPAGT